MTVDVWKYPTLEFVESLIGKINIGYEKLLTLTKSSNKNGTWYTYSFTRHHSEVFQNINRRTIKLS